MNDDRTNASDAAATPVNVEHQPARGRFAAELDGRTAVLEYMRVGDTVVFTHTEVPEGFEGRGIASALARAGLDHVRANDLVAAPLCPFMRAFVKRNPEYKELVGFGQRGERLG